MISFVALFIIVVLLLIGYIIKVNNDRPNNFPPGLPRLPLFGSYLHILKENYNFSHKALDSYAKKYKTNLLSFYMGDLPCVCATDTETCKELLSKEEFAGKFDIPLFRARQGGDLLGIFFVDGLYWQEQRRFSLRHMRDYGFGRRMDTIEEFTADQIRDMIDMLLSNPKDSEKDVCRNRGEIYMPDTFFGYYMNCIWFMLSGRTHKLRDLRDIARHAMGFQRAIDALGGSICIFPWLRHFAPTKFGWTAAVDDNAAMHEYCKKIVEEHLRTFRDDDNRDFIDNYIAQIKELENDNILNSSFTIKQLNYIVMDIMFAAVIPLSHATNYLFGYLLNYPELQYKIQEEIDRVVGRSRLPHLNDRVNMVYTEAVIREIIRFEPLNPLGLPRRSTKDTVLGGYFIPKDTLVMANVYSAHYEKGVWGDPEVFRPERWINDDGTLKRKDPTMGFGGGKRLCIGETYGRQTFFLFLTGLLQNFTFEAGDEIPDLKKCIWGINMSLPDYWMKAVPRP